MENNTPVKALIGSNDIVGHCLSDIYNNFKNSKTYLETKRLEHLGNKPQNNHSPCLQVLGCWGVGVLGGWGTQYSRNHLIEGNVLYNFPLYHILKANDLSKIRATVNTTPEITSDISTSAVFGKGKANMVNTY